MPITFIDNCIFWACWSASWKLSHGEVTEQYTLNEIQHMAEEIGEQKFTVEAVIESLRTPRVSDLSGSLFQLTYSSDGVLASAKLNQQAISKPQEWGFRK